MSDLAAWEIAERVRNKEVSAREVIDEILKRMDGANVALYYAHDLPLSFWSRDRIKRTCHIALDVDPSKIERAELEQLIGERELLGGDPRVGPHAREVDLVDDAREEAQLRGGEGADRDRER